MIEGTAFLMQNQPDVSGRNLYYWYYATQVMHNQPGPDWDMWNRKMRRALIDTQCKEGNCAAGSWDPKSPEVDAWGDSGGRIYMTSLAALTMEIYYRYLPLYKLNEEGGAAHAAAQPGGDKPALGKAAGAGAKDSGKTAPKTPQKTPNKDKPNANKKA
jgi:hypothetical protein